MPNWEEIQKEWETSKITLGALAEKHDVKLGTLKSRKSRDGWSRDAAKKDATIQKDATSKREKVATEQTPSGDAVKKNASSTVKKKEQKRRSGNPSPTPKFTKCNSAAVTHGLFSKFMPAETLEIMDSLLERHPADLIWDQIQIQYAAIIRAQQIMFVKDQDDMTKEVKKTETYSDDNADSEKQEWEIQFAWDKHATFLNAQSRAMGELRSLIKQFSEMAHDDDERRLKIEQMQVGIDRTKVEIEKLSGNNDDGPIEIMITRKGDR
ncbi:phage terminase small subunit [Sporosarcina sp. D27]|uniref:phage terminase small subunit n=1 Tax=Sporosarcina sp. D27 TaxID=1382305 RepID=UPI000471B7CC|nr:phage terminase small subunit [Sporosarcina sp. D27]